MSSFCCGSSGPLHLGFFDCTYSDNPVVTPVSRIWQVLFSVCIFGHISRCFLLGCCFIPFCIPDCKDVVHICPSCKQTLARVPRLKWHRRCSRDRYCTKWSNSLYPHSNFSYCKLEQQRSVKCIPPSRCVEICTVSLPVSSSYEVRQPRTCTVSPLYSKPSNCSMLAITQTSWKSPITLNRRTRVRTLLPATCGGCNCQQ